MTAASAAALFVDLSLQRFRRRIQIVIAFSNICAYSGLISPAAAIATRAVISSSDRHGAEGRHQRTASQSGAARAEADAP
jgi:hypothetical protein